MILQGVGKSIRIALNIRQQYLNIDYLEISKY